MSWILVEHPNPHDSLRTWEATTVPLGAGAVAEIGLAPPRASKPWKVQGTQSVQPTDAVNVSSEGVPALGCGVDGTERVKDFLLCLALPRKHSNF